MAPGAFSGYLNVGLQIMEAFKLIKDHELVLNVFGYWPSFHDAEIHWLKLERMNETYQGYFSPDIEFLIHGWEMTNEITEAGYYKLQKHHLVHFKFDDIFDIELDGFNHQNAIFDLRITKEPETSTGIIPLKILIDPAHGLGGEFKANKGYVMGVKPCDEKGKESQ